MKTILVVCWFFCLSVGVSAQDFATRFLDVHHADTNLIRVSISPKMMKEVLKIDADGDGVLLDIISKLKSMQLLTAQVNGKEYYRDALKLLDKNSNRFEPFLSFDDKSENFQIMVRKKNGTILELVMLIQDGRNFVVINFTGNMNASFITKLANSMELKRS